MVKNGWERHNKICILSTDRPTKWSESQCNQCLQTVFFFESLLTISLSAVWWRRVAGMRVSTVVTAAARGRLQIICLQQVAWHRHASRLREDSAKLRATQNGRVLVQSAGRAEPVATSGVRKAEQARRQRRDHPSWWQ